MTKVYDTKALWQKDKDHFMHPWANYQVFHEKGCDVIVKGDGVHVYDSEGNQFLDGIGGLWCVNIGYGREELAETAAKQMRDLAYYCPFTDLTNAPAAELAAKLAEMAPGKLNHVFYGCGGSVANDTAIRLVHYYFNKKGQRYKHKIISRVNSYHGSTYMSATLTGIMHDHHGFSMAQNVVEYISEANVYRMPEGIKNESEYLEYLAQDFENKIAELGAANVAAFIAEPIVGAGGVLVAPKGYHKRMYDICKKYDMLYISDEVVTAFGRLGEFFSSEAVFGIQPDIICAAKGITSGYMPLGVTIITDEIHDTISKDTGYFTHGFTYSGHPVSCAVALKNIEIMERENITDHVKEVGKYFREKLETDLKDLPSVGDVRGSHFMVAVENVADKTTKEPYHSLDIGKMIADACQKKGLIVRPIGHLNIMSPPLTITKENVDFIVETLKTCTYEQAEIASKTAKE